MMDKPAWREGFSCGFMLQHRSMTVGERCPFAPSVFPN